MTAIREFFAADKKLAGESNVNVGISLLELFVSTMQHNDDEKENHVPPASERVHVYTPI